MTEETGNEGETPTLESLQAELESTRDALKKANAEAADRRKRLESYEKDEKERQDKDLSESQKLQKELDEAKAERERLSAELQSERIRGAVVSKAMELGFANPEDAFQLADLSAVEITGGKVTGFEKSLEALAKSGRLAMQGEKSGDSLGTPPRKQQAKGGEPRQKTAPKIVL